MPAVDEVNTSAITNTADEQAIKKAISAMFWAWFNSHQDQKVTTVNFWFIHKTVYVRDLHDLFVLLFGEAQ